MTFVLFVARLSFSGFPAHTGEPFAGSWITGRASGLRACAAIVFLPCYARIRTDFFIGSKAHVPTTDDGSHGGNARSAAVLGGAGNGEFEGTVCLPGDAVRSFARARFCLARRSLRGCSLRSRRQAAHISPPLSVSPPSIHAPLPPPFGNPGQRTRSPGRQMAGRSRHPKRRGSTPESWPMRLSRCDCGTFPFTAC